MTVLNLQVAASADDGDQTATNTDVTRTSLPNVDSDSEWFGFRWPNVTIANAATINSATIQVYCLGSTQDEPLHNVDFEASDNAPAITAGIGNNNISGRTYTGSPVLWDVADLGIGAAGFVTTPDVTAPLQAVINRAGWASGNAVMAYIRQPTTSGTRDLGIGYYDGSSSQGAKLDIDYTAAGGAGQPTMLRAGGVPHMHRGPQLGRSW